MRILAPIVIGVPRADVGAGASSPQQGGGQGAVADKVGFVVDAVFFGLAVGEIVTTGPGATGPIMLQQGVKTEAKSLIKSVVQKTVGGNKTEIIERWMSKRELKATERTGLLRGGKVGTAENPHYVTDSANSDVFRARQRLALNQTPEVKVRLDVPRGSFSAPTKVEPKYNMPGGGTERKGYGRIPAKVVNED